MDDGKARRGLQVILKASKDESRLLFVENGVQQLRKTAAKKGDATEYASRLLAVTKEAVYLYARTAC